MEDKAHILEPCGQLLGKLANCVECAHGILYSFQFVHEKEIMAEDDQVFLMKLQV